MASEEYMDKSWMKDPAVIAGDVIGFILLTTSSIYLHTKISRYKGPEADNVYYFGYREEKFLASYVCFFAAMAYWARVCSHANGDTDDIANILTYKYLDYLVTCPILTIDLMWSLNLPYKFSCATNVAICILCAFACDSFRPPARYMWFSLGLSLFAWTWIQIIRVVRQRLDQFVCKVAQRMRNSLKLAVMTYFTVWCGYPIVWILKEIGVISPVASALIHTFLDVTAKSVYGIALLEFQMGGDKHAFIFIPLTPGMEERHEKTSGPKTVPRSNSMELVEDDVEAANPGGSPRKGSGKAQVENENEILEDDREEEGSESKHRNGTGESAMQKAQRLVSDWQADEDAKEDSGDDYGQEVQQMVKEVRAIKSEIHELMSIQSASATNSPRPPTLNGKFHSGPPDEVEAGAEPKAAAV